MTPPYPVFDRPWRPRPGWLGYGLAKVRSVVRPPVVVTDPPPGVEVESDVAITTRDNTVLRANVFRTADSTPRPVVLCAHPYGKDRMPTKRRGRWTIPWRYRIMRQPDEVRFSALTTWEAPDPAFWTATGFVVVAVDLRGAGSSDGVIDPMSAQEREDVADAVEWTAAQPWSDGNVVMLGVSYLAITQWGAASLAPPALRAICPWEGLSDPYRDLAYPGGVREVGFAKLWATGLKRSARLGSDLVGTWRNHPLRDDYWAGLAPDLTAITVPMLVCASFSDHTLHSRGSFRGFAQARSSHARLFTHRGGKWAAFYSEHAKAEQLAFFRDVLGGGADVDADDAAETGGSTGRTVHLEIREDRATVVEIREEHEWPLARTDWQTLFLTAPGRLDREPPASTGSVTFAAQDRAAVFTWTVQRDVELTGPMVARLFVEVAGSDDANLFVGVETWRGGRFVGFEGAQGYGNDRVTTGFARVALRALDPERSTPIQPVPACIHPEPVRPGEVVPVDVELLPSATLFRAGEQLRLVVAGRWLAPRNPLFGSFPTRYEPSSKGTSITLHWGPDRDAHLLVPVIARASGRAHTVHPTNETRRP